MHVGEKSLPMDLKRQLAINCCFMSKKELERSSTEGHIASTVVPNGRNGRQHVSRNYLSFNSQGTGSPSLANESKL